MSREQSQAWEAEFLSRTGDAAAVYRFGTEEIADRTEPLERVRLSGGSPIASGYELIATGPIMRGADAAASLDEYRANGFARPGDIVAFKQGGVVTCWSVDLLAFSKLPGLLENYLRTAELSTEQNCNQIDGIINNVAPKHDELSTEDEALFLVGRTAYLHVQTGEDERSYTHDDCCATYDYILYDKETMGELDSGRMEVVADIRDEPWEIHRLAAQNILECRTIYGGSSLEAVPLELLETFRDAAIKTSKPSLRDGLKQLQREAADRSQGTGFPSRPRPGQER